MTTDQLFEGLEWRLPSAPDTGVSPPLAYDRVTCPQQINELLCFLMRERVPGVVSTASGPCNTRIVAADARGLHFHGEVSDWPLPTRVSFLHLNTLYQIPIDARSVGRSVPVPAWIGKVARRRARRAAAPAGLSMRFRRPLASELSLNAEVIDFSRSGLSFRARVDTDLLLPGLSLPVFTLHWAGQEYGHFAGRICNLRREASRDDAVVGVSFEPLGGADAAGLTRLLDAILYPSTLGRASDVWNVFESSGYLHLSGKTPSDFEPLRVPFSRVARALEAAPEVGTIAHWPATGPIQATVSHLKVYQSSWLLCQVSKLKGQTNDSRPGLREMYLRIYESAHGDADTRWLLVYVQDKAPRWSRELHVDLPKRFVQTGEACLVPFRALEADSADDGAPDADGDLRVVHADTVTAHCMMRDLARVRPAQYLDALDFSEARFHLGEVRARWNRAGLSRARELLVAYQGGVRCAMAVVEIAEIGAHLYGLLDCLRMYPLRPGGERAFGSLLRAARAWFRAHGRKRFTYLEEYPHTLPLRELGFRDLGGATFTMLSIDRLPELLQRTSDLASQRPAALGPIDLAHV